jgi:hypothetical protein
MTDLDLDLDAAAEQIEEATRLLTDRLVPADILRHRRLKAAVMGLGPSWAYVKQTLDVVEADRRRRITDGVVREFDDE